MFHCVQWQSVGVVYTRTDSLGDTTCLPVPPRHAAHVHSDSLGQAPTWKMCTFRPVVRRPTQTCSVATEIQTQSLPLEYVQYMLIYHKFVRCCVFLNNLFFSWCLNFVDFFRLLRRTILVLLSISSILQC